MKKELYRIKHRKSGQGILTITRYKNGYIKKWIMRTDEGLYLADNKTSILVLMYLLKEWDITEELQIEITL